MILYVDPNSLKHHDRACIVAFDKPIRFFVHPIEALVTANNETDVVSQEFLEGFPGIKQFAVPWEKIKQAA